ncbi:MAG: dipeptidase [Bacteroidales bacterium]|nr:dipeptidase [Bacteroidales bacterium]
MFVLDSHCDTPSQIIRLRDLRLDSDHSQVDFPKLRRGGVDGSFFALYTPASLSSGEARVYADRLLDATLDSVAASGSARLALSPEEALENKGKGLFSVFIGMENASPIGGDLGLLTYYYNRGVRYVTLCHSRDNLVCDSCASANGTWNGLSPFGREVVRRMNELGLIVDVSHISDSSFYDVIKTSKAPVVATHSCCRALCSHPRNMTDDMIRALAANGGVIQINFYPLFLSDSFSKVLADSRLEETCDKVEEAFIADPADGGKRASWYSVLDRLSALERPSYKRIVDHIDHVVSLVGTDHVGLGSDFDGIAVTPEGMDDVSALPKIFDEMRSRGYNEAEIEKVAGANFLRLWNEVIRSR